MKDIKGFTLIELLAVLVVLAILALISIPITIKIINGARENSYKRSIAAYGQAVENTIGEYLLNTDIDYSQLKLSSDSDYISYNNNDLEIQYSGNKVICQKLNFKDNGDIILRMCKVENSQLYKYEDKKVVEDGYKIGDLIKVKDIELYVIQDSPNNQNYVTALKKEPLTVEEVEIYGEGHINRYTGSNQNTVVDHNGYGYIVYYTSETCGLVNGEWVGTNCDPDYDISDFKYIVDNWSEQVISNDLMEEVDGYRARLISKDDLQKMGFKYNSSSYCYYHDAYPSWFYNRNYRYRTMIKASDYQTYIVSEVGRVPFFNTQIYDFLSAVRPVINVKKSAIE